MDFKKTVLKVHLHSEANYVIEEFCSRFKEKYKRVDCDVLNKSYYFLESDSTAREIYLNDMEYGIEIITPEQEKLEHLLAEVMFLSPGVLSEDKVLKMKQMAKEVYSNI